MILRLGLFFSYIERTRSRFPAPRRGIRAEVLC
jgi:hypothetical protein